MPLLSLGLFLLFILVTLGVAYLYLLAAASLLPPPLPAPGAPPLRFAVAIPAHDEAQVIGRTIATLRAAQYPKELLDIYVVADFCTDGTAQAARQAGAQVFERSQGERSGKGAALAALFEHIFAGGAQYQAVAVFDADTQVEAGFFQVMSARLSADAAVVQGNHIIRNPGAGWFPALTWAMFLVDNRCQNLGRANLGLSAKNMGDSICFRAELLQRLGWGAGLTEDYAFRQRLLLEGVRIAYEPTALGYGDAAANWQEARAQRARWLRGAYLASRQSASAMLAQGLRRGNPALLDGALQAYLPSYSTLTLLASAVVILAWLLRAQAWAWLPWAWGGLFLLLFLYPLISLAFERAPLRAYLVILTGPLFILWRTWLSISARFFQRGLGWVRTPRHVDPPARE